MYLTECPSSIWGKVKIKCDQCGVEYNGRAQSSRDQLSNLGHHECRKCVSSRVGKKVQADNPDLGKKISAAKKGVPLSEEHKAALRGRVVTAETKSKMSESAKRRVRKPRVCDAMQDCVCADCGVSYKGRVKTVSKQQRIWGVAVCRKCKSSRVGKLVGKKMQDVYRQNFLTNNPMNKQEYRDKISEALSGRLFSEKHKQSLRKPKSNTENIKEAANRPEERERRSKLMADRLISGNHNFVARNHFVLTKKSGDYIRCRSRLEVAFLKKLDHCKRVISVCSAEYLKLPYNADGCNKTYLPDFELLLDDGRILIIEVKSVYYMKRANTAAKLKTLINYTNQNNYMFGLVTERTMAKWLERLNYGK